MLSLQLIPANENRTNWETREKQGEIVLFENKIKFSIIIPAFNEEKEVGNTLNKLINYLRENFDKKQYEVILVDDGSTDSTYEIASNIQDVRAVKHNKNKGYGASLKTGVKIASHDYVVFYDADGQHQPGYIKDIVSEMPGYDMVVGERIKGSYIPAQRIVGKKILSILANYLTGVKIPDLNSGFRAFKKATLLKYLHLLPDGFSASITSTLIIITKGYEYKYILIKTEKRVGKSTVNQVRDGFYSMLLIIKIVSLFNPLKIFLPISILSTLFGIIYGVYKLITVKMFFPVGGLIFIIFGIVAFFFGIIAEQISELVKMQKE